MRAHCRAGEGKADRLPGKCNIESRPGGPRLLEEPAASVLVGVTVSFVRCRRLIHGGVGVETWRDLYDLHFSRGGSTPATRGCVGSTTFWAEGKQKSRSLLGFPREGRGANRVGPASWSDLGGPGA